MSGNENKDVNQTQEVQEVKKANKVKQFIENHGTDFALGVLQGVMAMGIAAVSGMIVGTVVVKNLNDNSASINDVTEAVKDVFKDTSDVKVVEF